VNIKRIAEIGYAGLVAAVVLACSGAAKDIAHKALSDAAGFLSDASTALQDSGDAVASRAWAQQACGTCTTGGAVRMATADSDPERIRSGYEVVETGASAEWLERVAGPFIVTHLVPADSGVSGSAEIAYADRGCETGRTMLARVAVSSSAPAGSASAVQNGRFLVPDGKVLCVRGTGEMNFSWSGFRPYE
jgi:hypothetical protein